MPCYHVPSPRHTNFASTGEASLCGKTWIMVGGASAVSTVTDDAAAVDCPDCLAKLAKRVAIKLSQPVFCPSCLESHPFHDGVCLYCGAKLAKLR